MVITILDAHTFSTFGERLSGPLAVFILSPFSILVTPAYLMLGFSITGWRSSHSGLNVHLFFTDNGRHIVGLYVCLALHI